jgi:hypothetical protein
MAAQPTVDQSFLISRLYNSQAGPAVTIFPREKSQIAAFAPYPSCAN